MDTIMYILDTDHLSLIQRNGQEGKRILAKLSEIKNNSISVTVITYEEQVRGRLNLVSKAKTIEEKVRAYRGIQQISMDYRFITVISFDKVAALEEQRLRKAYPRLGKMDLKIAAITLVNHATLLTRNYSDFWQIIELSTEDWSI